VAQSGEREQKQLAAWTRTDELAQMRGAPLGDPARCDSCFASVEWAVWGAAARTPIDQMDLHPGGQSMWANMPGHIAAGVDPCVSNGIEEAEMPWSDTAAKHACDYPERKDCMCPAAWNVSLQACGASTCRRNGKHTTYNRFQGLLTGVGCDRRMQEAETLANRMRCEHTVANKKADCDVFLLKSREMGDGRKGTHMRQSNIKKRHAGGAQMNKWWYSIGGRWHASGAKKYAQRKELPIQRQRRRSRKPHSQLWFQRKRDGLLVWLKRFRCG